MKKILLVNTNTEQSPYPVSPIGLCLLASSLGTNYEISIFDGMFTPAKDLVQFINEFQPDFIGFGIRNIDNMTAENVRYYVTRVMDDFILPVKASTHVPLILGGSGFSIFPAELMRLSGADYGLTGEAEETFPALLESLINNQSLNNIPGLFIKDKAGCSSSDYSYLSQKSNHSAIDLRIEYQPYLQRSSYPIQTKRGCVHKCLYCSYPLIEGSSYRIRNPKDIADEIEQVYNRLGAVNFEFVDSTFNDPKGHAEEICREIIRKKIPVTFRTMGMNPLNVNAHLVELMQKTGFRQIDCTPDTASEKMLVNLRKNFRKEHIKIAAKLFREAGMPVMWFFLFGGPGESMDSISETESFIAENIDELDMAHLSAGMRIYPGTGLYNTALRERKIKEGQSLLEPFFYQPESINLKEISQIISEMASRHYNCVPSSESAPPMEMIQRALLLQKQHGKPEPMFRTLLRIRKEMMSQ